MKKTLSFCIILILVFQLVSCGKSIVSDSKTSEETVENNLFNGNLSDGKSEVDTDKEFGDSTINIQIGENILKLDLVDNSSVDALVDYLEKNSISIEMKDYGGMEKVGDLGINLPKNDMQVDSKFGDVILYQGNKLVIYYESNSWNFTPIGTLNGVTKEKLKQILTSGDITVKLMLISTSEVN